VGIALKGMATIAALLVIFSAQGYSSQRRGFAVQTVTGYQVSNVKYWTGEGGFVEAVEFDLDAPAREVSALLRSDGEWLTCTIDGDVLSWTCPLRGEPLHMNDADAFQVRAH
jgi:hypothetical protein